MNNTGLSFVHHLSSYYSILDSHHPTLSRWDCKNRRRTNSVSHTNVDKVVNVITLTTLSTLACEAQGKVCIRVSLVRLCADLTQTLGWWQGKFSLHFCSAQPSLLNRNILWKAPHTCVDQWQNLQVSNNIPVLNSHPKLTLECLSQHQSLSLAHRTSLPVPLQVISKLADPNSERLEKRHNYNHFSFLEKIPDLEPDRSFPPASRFRIWQGFKETEVTERRNWTLSSNPPNTHAAEASALSDADSAIVIHFYVSPVLIANY